MDRGRPKKACLSKLGKKPPPPGPRVAGSCCSTTGSNLCRWGWGSSPTVHLFSHPHGILAPMLMPQPCIALIPHHRYHTTTSNYRLLLGHICRRLVCSATATKPPDRTGLIPESITRPVIYFPTTIVPEWFVWTLRRAPDSSVPLCRDRERKKQTTTEMRVYLGPGPRQKQTLTTTAGIAPTLPPTNNLLERWNQRLARGCPFLFLARFRAGPSQYQADAWTASTSSVNKNACSPSTGCRSNGPRGHSAPSRETLSRLRPVAV